MGVRSEQFQEGDVYIDYDFEDVLFRFDHASRRVFRKWYGQGDEFEVPNDNNLYQQAIRFGDAIDAETYQKGK